MTDLPDLTHLSVKQLMQLEAGIVTELLRRELVRTNNKPLGDIAEYIVWLARGGELAPTSAKSHDIVAANGDLIQVKAMGNRKVAGPGQTFSAFRSEGYSTAVFLVFDRAFEIVEAYEVAAGQIEQNVKYVQHVAARAPSLKHVRTLGTDVTAEMRAAYARIDGESSVAP